MDKIASQPTATAARWVHIAELKAEMDAASDTTVKAMILAARVSAAHNAGTLGRHAIDGLQWAKVNFTAPEDMAFAREYLESVNVRFIARGRSVGYPARFEGYIATPDLFQTKHIIDLAFMLAE